MAAFLGGCDPDQMVCYLLTGRQGTKGVASVDQRMDRRIAHLALARFRVGGFVGTSIADLAGDLGVSKAAIYYHYRSKDTLLHRLVDPLLDAIDACIQDHNQPRRTARQLLGAYLAVLLAHREVVPLVATDVAVLNHPSIGPRLHAQNQQLQSLLTAPDTSTSARLRAEAALGAIWRPLIAQPPLDLTDPTHQHTLVDAAVAALQPSQSLPDGELLPAAHIGRHAEHP
jgi:AcrR family transcriptional regulator